MPPLTAASSREGQPIVRARV